MSHNTTARTVFGVTYETIIRRILATFDRATASDLEAGARWYDEAGTLAADLAQHVVGGIETTACLISALSPRTEWTRNVAGAVALANGLTAEACMSANVDRAEDVLQAGRTGTDPFEALGNGPKVRAFARNIAGDRESVTVDVWACRVASLDENKLTRKGAYDMVADAYRAAARRRGVDPATMQATTWVVARNGRAS